MNRIILFLTIFCSSVHLSLAQKEESEIRAELIFRVADKFEWNTNSDSLKIAVFPSATNLYNNLKKKEINDKINNKQVVVTLVNSLRKIEQYDIVILHKAQDDFLPEIKSNIGNKQQLIITNNSDDLTNSMINFYLNSYNKIRFQINKQYLEKQHLTPSNTIIILGGSEEELMELMEKKDFEVVQEKLKAQKLEAEIKQQYAEVENLKEEYNNILKNLAIKESDLQKKNRSIDSMNTFLKEKTKMVNSVKNRIDEIRREIHTREEKLAEQKAKIIAQEDIFQLQQQSLSNQTSKIDQQKSILKEQESMIELQERNLKITFVFAIGLLIISVFALFSFLGKQKSNRALADRNKKLNDALLELQQAQAKLIQNEKMASLGMVTAGMAHEINNPMNFITAGIGILEQEISSVFDSKKNSSIDAETLENILLTIKDIRLGSNRVIEIIRSLQNFSRLDENDLKLASIKEGIKSTLIILKGHIKEKQAEINAQFADDVDLIECYPGSINQVLSNLIANAIDATEKGKGKIKITTKKIDNNCIIRIADNGQGIPQELLSKIFDPFFTTKEVGMGTGLGLSISFGIIKKHKGDIQVESELGKGTIMQIELPIKQIS